MCYFPQHLLLYEMKRKKNQNHKTPERNNKTKTKKQTIKLHNNFINIYYNKYLFSMCSSTHQKNRTAVQRFLTTQKDLELEKKKLQRKILKVKKCPPLFMSNKLRIDNHKKLYK